MELQLKLVLGCSLALLLGLAVSVPVFFSNLPAVKIRIDVDTVYAYFAVQEFNQSITGLWRNIPDHPSYDLVFYFIVLNVTNRFNGWARIDQFKVSAGPEIFVINGTETLGSQKLASTHNATSSGVPPSTMFVIGAENPLMTDVRDMSKGGDGWASGWPANASRLIGLSGMVQVSYPSYEGLTNGSLYIYGQAEGKASSGGSVSRGFDLKYVQLLKMGREFLYNPVFAESQMLQLGHGLDVYVTSRGQ